MPKKDTLWGVSRYADSPNFGALMLDWLNLWKEPAPYRSAKDITGALAHGVRVEILQVVVTPDGDTWTKVRGKSTFKDPQSGKKIHRDQVGFIRAVYLKNMGQPLVDEINALHKDEKERLAAEAEAEDQKKRDEAQKVTDKKKTAREKAEKKEAQDQIEESDQVITTYKRKIEKHRRRKQEAEDRLKGKPNDRK